MLPVRDRYGAMPMIHALCGSVTIALNIQIADRIIDSLNALSTAKHKRLTLEQESLPSMLWLSQYILSTIMFSGVFLILSGSLELNIFMCVCTSIMIGLNSLLIADMDMPYIGFMKINKQPLLELVRDMKIAATCPPSPLPPDAALGSGKSSNPLEKLAASVIACQRLKKDNHGNNDNNDDNSYGSDSNSPTSHSKKNNGGNSGINMNTLVRNSMRPAMKPANKSSAQVYAEVGDSGDLLVTNI